MIRRYLVSAGLAAACAAAPAAATLQARPDSTHPAAGPREKVRADRGQRRGNLFSAVCFADSALGKEWSRLRPEAQGRFPDLKLSQVADLHITVVYIGGDWQPGSLDTIRALALVVPTTPVKLTPEIVRMGRNNQVVAVELHGTSSVWGDSVIAAKSTLNRLGLKKPEAYDTNFRTHITLAQAIHSPPSPADSTALAGFATWISSKVADSPQRFTVTVGPTTRVQLLLADTSRPEGAPEYIPVEDFLERQPPPPPGK